MQFTRLLFLCARDTYLYFFKITHFFSFVKKHERKFASRKKCWSTQCSVFTHHKEKIVEFFTKKIIIAQYGCIFIICNFILLGKFASLKNHFSHHLSEGWMKMKMKMHLWGNEKLLKIIFIVVDISFKKLTQKISHKDEITQTYMRKSLSIQALILREK